MHVGGIVYKKLNVIPSTGYYKNENEFVKDAVNTLLSVRKELRIAVACELYVRAEVPFGKICEMAYLDDGEMKEVLHKKGIMRAMDAPSLDSLLRSVHTFDFSW